MADYNAHVILSGIKPGTDKYRRGGKIAEGTLAAMVKLGLEKIEDGFTGVCILCEPGVDGAASNGLIDEAGIREIAARSDLPA